MYSHLPYNPSALEDAPLYVNAKQYNRILKRRQARARLESNHMILPRKDKVNFNFVVTDSADNTTIHSHLSTRLATTGLWNVRGDLGVAFCQKRKCVVSTKRKRRVRR